MLDAITLFCVFWTLFAFVGALFLMVVPLLLRSIRDRRSNAAPPETSPSLSEAYTDLHGERNEPELSGTGEEEVKPVRS